MNAMKQASTTYYNEVCANIRQLKSLQWQVVIVSVAMLAAVPAIGDIDSGESMVWQIRTAKLAFCLIATIYAVWHIHRYQAWLTLERQNRLIIERQWMVGEHPPDELRSMHSAEISYWFDGPALVSWWSIILCTGLLSVLDIVQ